MGRTRIEAWRGEPLPLARAAELIWREGLRKGSEAADWAFLDSSLQGKNGRYSILGLYPYLQAEERDGVLFVNGEKQTGDLLGFMKGYLEENREARGEGEPVMTAGAIGWLSYDYGRKRMGIASRHAGGQACRGLPDGRFVFYDLYLIEDLQEKRLWICTGEKLADMSAYRAKVRRWAEETAASCTVEDPARSEVQTAGAGTRNEAVVFSSDYGREDYERTIEHLIEYMRAGDMYVMNMTRRITAPYSGDPYRLFQYLREHNPSPFGAFLSCGEAQIVCASPERFLQVRDGVAKTSPIKGTRRRGVTPEEDQRLKQALAASEKDKSELMMVVDLERNDLNRVCVPGSVKVPRMYSIESFATVHHLVSDVTGRLQPACGAVDLLETAFPGGSITGAPKYRAMEIIDAEEHSARGLYTGTIGYLGLDGDCDFTIVIRTAVLQDGRVSIGAGGGITVDSDPAFEYAETEQKAAALIEAIGRTQGQEKACARLTRGRHREGTGKAPGSAGKEASYERESHKG